MLREMFCFKGRKREGKKGFLKEKGRRKEERPRKKSTGQVKKDVTGWTVVTRNKRQRRMIQIFVKVDEAKVTPMEVSLMDGKVEDVMRQVQKGRGRVHDNAWESAEKERKAGELRSN